MSLDDRIITRFGRLVAAGAIVVGGASAVILAFLGWDTLVEDFGLHNGVEAVGFGVIVLVALGTQPRNGAVWALAGASFFAALQTLGVAVLALYERADPSLAAPTVRPADLPLGAALALQPIAWAWIPAVFLLITVFLLLFPDGAALSERWWWVGKISVAAMVALSLGLAWSVRPWSTAPIGSSEEMATVALVVFSVVLVASIGTLLAGSVLSLVSLVLRYRRSTSVVRHQIRWLVWGGVLVAVSIAWLIVLGGGGGGITALIAFVGELLMIVAIAFAMTRYRLYDIDVVISRTVTFGVLAVFITGVYVVVVVGVGSLVGGSSLVLAVGATALVALLFEPIRSRVQGWANRLVFGERATPYAVLSALTARYASGESNEEALGRLAGLVASGTGAIRSVVWLRVGDRLRPEAVVGEGGGSVESVRLDGDAVPDLGGEVVEPILHGGELLGALSIVKDRADPVSPGDRQLLVDVAAGAGLLLRNIRLNAELADRADELRLSRRRLVAAQDAERRRLERNLHDGAQQQVVALKVKLGLARTLAEREDLSEIADAVGELAADTQRAVDGMRTVARGIYPPLLEAEGLGAALAAVARDASSPVVVEADGVGRYPAEVEATVYFSVLEAIGQSSGSPGEPARVRVEDDAGVLGFTVAGITVPQTPGVGLSSVADRIDALGGVLTSDPATGTITGSLPATALEPA